jgi:hypothetical protein
MFPVGTQPLAGRWRASRHHRIASQNYARSRQGSKRLQRRACQKAGAHIPICRPQKKRVGIPALHFPASVTPSGVRALLGPVTGGVATLHAPATSFVPFRNGGFPGKCAPDSLNTPQTYFMFP